MLDTKNKSWKKIIITQYKPKRRACHTLSRIGRKIYLYGGYDGNESFGSIEVFDIDTQLWSSLNLNINSFNPSPRNAHTANVINKKIYVFGGHFQNLHLNDLVIFDATMNEWSNITLQGSIPNGIRGHTASFIYNKLYFFGGYNGKSRCNDIYRLTLEDFNFIKIKNNKDTIFPRQKHSANIINNKRVIFFGGFEGARWLNSVDILNVATLEENISLQKSKMDLNKDFRHLLNNKDYSDVTFLIQNKCIYAHKIILFGRVEYFRHMFSEYMMEKNSSLIEIKEFDYETFLLFLEFIYTSDIGHKDIRQLIKLYEIADAYSFNSLKKYCEDLISLALDTNIAIDILIIAYKCDSHVLENIALKFISQNRKEICKNENLNYLLEYPALMLKIINNLN